MMSDAIQHGDSGSSTPEDDSNIRLNLQIDLKWLVGDAIGNMSISPGSRDVVLATRNGLFIIDLEAPLNVPRFLPQGGTWDVADVQWNPHMARGEYIVSTSSEKLLIWNLFLTGRTSIEHVLHSHYRAITDINWHTTEPDTVISTGIDSWLWAWDLRGPHKPVMGLCAFGCGGTQVKWNRQDGNLLASSHQNEVFLWDRRKGSLPISRMKAHAAKIYGIDWSHDRRDEIVTCSLDRSIKVWDTQTMQPKFTIQTAYPVWRARDLPFSRGLLSLPQRGETALELYSHEDPSSPVEMFEGHEDVVKEFVWRKGGQDNSEFQLITWSKDKTLRFWPVDTEVMKRTGKVSPVQASTTESQRRELKVSFSNPPIGTDLPPALSAPVGHRGILAEVRAPFPPRHARVDSGRPPPVATLTDIALKDPHRDRSATSSSRPIPITQEKGQTMTRGHIGGRSAQITTIAWLSSVKVGAKRDGSSGPGSGAESGNVSRWNSRSRPSSLVGRSTSYAMTSAFRGGDLGEKGDDLPRDGEPSQSLQDEITSVVNRLSASKVRLEKADLTKKRTCSFGLQGPWGESTSVFIRVSFTFPRDYPQSAYPNGIPSVELEKNPLISTRSRDFIRRRLRAIREHERPCLEKCLRFLLYGDNDDPVDMNSMADSDSSSDEDTLPIARRKGPRFSLPRGDKNLAELRTSQGVFSANGTLVCFFRAPPRIVRNVMPEISVSPSVATRGKDSTVGQLRSPVSLSVALRRLTGAAQDRDATTTEPQQTDDANNILRIVSNLFIFSQHKARRMSEHSRPFEDSNSYSLLSTRRSMVYIKDVSKLVGVDFNAAEQYSLAMLDPPEVCKRNADIARTLGRTDHERIFRLLQAALTSVGRDDLQVLPKGNGALIPTLEIVHRLYFELSANKDIQMLAMLSMMLLRTSLASPPSHSRSETGTPESGRPMNHRDLSLSPIWSRASPSPTRQPVAPPLSSPSSSRGSWSSLFHTSTMKQFVGVGPRMRSSGPEGGRVEQDLAHSSRSTSRDSSVQPTPFATKSWSEVTNVVPIASAVTFSSDGHARRPTFSQVLAGRSTAAVKKQIVLSMPLKSISSRATPLAHLSGQFLCHVLIYAEILLIWDLPEKRSKLLKSVENAFHAFPIDSRILENKISPGELGSFKLCKHRANDNGLSIGTCSECKSEKFSSCCAVCHLPVKRLSHVCLTCSHITHIACWEGWKDVLCASGCGCQCARSVERPRKGSHGQWDFSLRPRRTQQLSLGMLGVIPREGPL